MDENVEVFIMYIISLSLNSILIYLAQEAQIALLIVKKVKMATKYLDFLDIFLKKKFLVLLAIINLSQYIIELQKGQQLVYRPIHSLSLVKFKILKTYIKTNLINGFI